ncbi:MAG: trypsin-like peptidase domain-containing protein [Acidimicrobiales bacterium]
MPTEDEMREIKTRAAERLLQVPGVVAVGLGGKEVGGEPTGELVIKVFVREKRPAAEVPPDELIPTQIEGIATDVVVGGDRRPVVDPPGGLPDETRYTVRERPLVGGCRIGVVGTRIRGTLGCLVRHTTDATRFYVLTCQHVVAPPDRSAPVAGTTEIGQPDGKSSCSECCDDVVGKYAGGGMTSERDEALVQLKPGMTWRAEIIAIGAVAGRHTVTQAEVATGTYKVRKHGMRTRLTGGVITALDASTSTADNIIVVRPNPNSAAGTRTVFFSYEGDSGSALVNDANEVVGLIDARDDVGNGYAFPIANVLARLASIESVTVEVATAATAGVVNTVPGAAMVAVPQEVVSALSSRRSPDERVVAVAPGWALPVPPPEPAMLQHLQGDLDRSPSGRRLMTLWLRHQDELLALINDNRRVATTWHRSGAAALFQLATRLVVDPSVRLPETVHGQPLSAVFDRVHEMLRQFASPAMRAELDRVRAALPDLAGLTYRQALDALDAS